MKFKVRIENNRNYLLDESQNFFKDFTPVYLFSKKAKEIENSSAD